LAEWQGRASAEATIEVFAEKYRARYGRAVECLTKVRDAMPAFYDFHAEHRDHLRTTNPIESLFATVRLRTVRSKGSLSPTTAKLTVFKLVIAASETWRRLKAQIGCRSSSQVPDLTKASRSSKCRKTTPPDRLVTQDPACCGHEQQGQRRGHLNFAILFLGDQFHIPS
jgi:hypothetical protein